MRIGKVDQPYSAISTSTPERITVRGRDVCGDVVGHMDFSSYFWLLVTGAEPTPDQKFFTDAVLCAIAEHGLVPSVVAARMTYAAAPEAFQGAVAAGLNGCGTVVLGSAEIAGVFLHDCVRAAREDGLTAAEAARRGLTRLKEEGKRVPGFGHSFHSDGDPRALLLLKLAKERGVEGPYAQMLTAIQDAIPEVTGRTLPVNVNGAIPTVMLDVGFPLSALKGISLLARTASLIAHLHEETQRPIGFILSNHAAQAISYDGEDAPEPALER